MREIFKYIADNYIRDCVGTYDGANPTGRKITTELPAIIGGFDFIQRDRLLYVKGSAGGGKWSGEPWVMIGDKSIFSRGASKGFFLVYMLSEDMNKLSLSLSQGKKFIKDYYAPMRINGLESDAIRIVAKAAANYWRTKLQAAGLTLPGVAEAQQTDNDICGITYNLQDLPSDDDMKRDLIEMLSIFAELRRQMNGSTKEEMYNIIIAKDPTTKELIDLSGVLTEQDRHDEAPAEENPSEESESAEENPPMMNEGTKEAIDYHYSSANAGGSNTIYYGTPGCGKSTYVAKKVLQGSFDDENVFRVTFYQDYTYTDFVGQIMPTLKYDANNEPYPHYQFVPGPFTLAFERAIAKPDKKVAIVIEEINRGNAPSIFGDLFQLLDRLAEDAQGYPAGTSEYGIACVCLLNYLKDNHRTNRAYNYHFTPDEIRLPANLYLFATMNTSDQNVFTLDTAFKRRWDSQKISNTFTSDDNEIGARLVPGMAGCTWRTFVEQINRHMLGDRNGIDSEDRQIGKYFVKKSMLLANGEDVPDLAEKTKAFAYKVLEYLWNDVAKFNRQTWFAPTITSLDDLITEYCQNGQAVFAADVFSNQPVEGHEG